MVYYGLGLNAGSLSGDIFTNNVLNAAMEIAARMTIPFLMGEWPSELTYLIRIKYKNKILNLDIK